MRKLLWIAGLAMLVLVTCNYDEGACWIDGQGDGAVGAGGGPILPPGAGGFGDVPPEPQGATDATVDCDPGDDGATELGELKCPKAKWGPDCMIICAEYGVPCPPGRRHSVTNEMGSLFKCCNCKGDQRCWYAYEDGNFCVLRPETGIFTCGI